MLPIEMARPKVQRKFVLWLLAAAFFALQTAALAHELQHDLRQHNEAACALHLHAEQTGQAAAGSPLPVAVVLDNAPTRLAPAQVHASAALAYYTRAPPVSIGSHSA